MTMKFIPGRRFVNMTMKNTKLFERNKLYVLRNIKPNGKYLEYSFQVGEEIKTVNFESVEQADTFLATIVY